MSPNWGTSRLGLSPYWWTPDSAVAFGYRRRRGFGESKRHTAEQRKWRELGGRNHVCLGSSYVFVRATNTYEEPTYRATSGAPRGGR